MGDNKNLCLRCNTPLVEQTGLSLAIEAPAVELPTGKLPLMVSLFTCRKCPYLEFRQPSA